MGQCDEKTDGASVDRNSYSQKLNTKRLVGYK